MHMTYAPDGEYRTVISAVPHPDPDIAARGGFLVTPDIGEKPILIFTEEFDAWRRLFNKLEGKK